MATTTTTLDSKISDILQRAIDEAKIVGHFQYGHNLLQSSVQIDEIFSMLDTIIKNVLTVIDDVIPDLNLAPYEDGRVDSTRANLCWIKLKENYYGLILNTQRGIRYQEFDEEDMQNLLLNGQVSSWYLVSKIQNLSYLLANESTGMVEQYFKKLITDIIERFFYEHEHSAVYHPAGAVDVDELENTFSMLQIQNTRSPVPARSSEDNDTDIAWSSSLINTPTGKICWQTAANVPLEKTTPAKVQTILSSKYFNAPADVEVFLEETYYKRKSTSTLPNEFCFLSRQKLSYSYVDLNYVVECQLIGYITIVYNNGQTEDIYPDTQPIIIEKGKNYLSIMTVFKLSNDLTKKVKEITMSDDGILPNLKLTFSCTGVNEKRNIES